MSKNNIQVILNGKTSIDQLLTINDDQGFSKAVLTKKSASKLLNLLKENVDKSDGPTKVATILKKFSSNSGAIKQMSDLRTHLPYLMDKILQIALEEQPGNKDYMKIVQSYIYENPILKSSLCLSVQEYILNAIDSRSISSDIIKDTLEVLVTIVTHHPDNRTNFIRRMKPETLGNIFSIVASSGDPMVQLYGTEFLWRIAIPMKCLTEEGIHKLFGNMGDALYSIKAENFRKGLIDFIVGVNLPRTDSNAVLCTKIEELLIGHKHYDDDSIAMAGSTGINIWSGDDMITLPKEDIEGIWQDDDHFIIRLSEKYDTLLDYFSEDKIISFISNDLGSFGEICRARYKIGDPNDIPYIPISNGPQTPQPRLRSFNKKTNPKPSSPVKSSKQKSEKRKEDQPHALTPRIIQSRPASKKSYKETITTEESLSSYTPPPPRSPKKSTYKDWLRAEEKKKALKLSEASIPSTEKMKKSNIPQNSLKSSPQNKENNQNKQSIQPQKTLSSDSSDTHELIIDSDSVFDSDSLSNPSQTNHCNPPSNLNMNDNSNNFNSSNNKSSNDNSNNSNSNNTNSNGDNSNNDNLSNNVKNDIIMEHFKDHITNNAHENNVFKVSTLADELQIYDHFSEPELPEITRRDYTPEGWEIEIFEELRNFGECIREELNSRQSAVQAALETTAAQALDTVRDFVLQCDAELEAMRDEFNSSAEAMAEELEQKQAMVGALGEQQCDHIDDMIEECTNLSKRISDTLNKMESQKKALQENQQKHIQLFKEDLKNELLSKRTTKRTRNTKKNTEILNNLLNGL